MDTASPPKTKKRLTPDLLSPRTLSVRLLAAGGACLLAGAAALCARAGLAELIAADAIVHQTTLQERAARSGDPVAFQDAMAVVEALRQAQRLDPANPTTAEELGSLYALNVREMGGVTGSQRAKSLEQYARAAVMRPTSPYSWANLAWTQYYLGQVDAEFYRALDSAIRLGPWEPEVQFVVVDLGLALWQEMPADLRPRILAVAQHSQMRYAPQILAIARKRGHLREVCGFEKLAKLAACKAMAG